MVCALGRRSKVLLKMTAFCMVRDIASEHSDRSSPLYSKVRWWETQDQYIFEKKLLPCFGGKIEYSYFLDVPCIFSKGINVRLLPCSLSSYQSKPQNNKKQTLRCLKIHVFSIILGTQTIQMIKFSRVAVMASLYNVPIIFFI